MYYYYAYIFLKYKIKKQQRVKLCPNISEI